MSKFKPILIIILNVLSLSLVLAVFSELFTDKHWLIEVIASLKYEYVIWLSLFLIAYIFLRKYKTAVAIALIMLLSIFSLTPYYAKPVTAQKIASQPIKVIFSNVLYLNHDYSKLIDFIRAEKPDVIVLAENYESTVLQIQQEMPEYKHTKSSIDRGSFGLSMLSKTDINNDIEIKLFGTSPHAALIGNFVINSKEFYVIGTHPYPSLNEQREYEKKTHFAELAEYIATLNSPVILTGDFNTTSNSYIYKNLLKNGNLKDSRLSFGTQNSFPSHLPQFLRIAIDHAVVNDYVTVENRYLGPNIGSDHLPIVVEVKI